jgi:hypothetical protein
MMIDVLYVVSQHQILIWCQQECVLAKNPENGMELQCTARAVHVV